VEDEKKKNEEQEEEKAKTPAELMKEMQEAHAAALAKLQKELEDEKSAHAKDVKDLLLNGKKSGNGAVDRVEEIRQKMRKKYYK
jgi:hypothetical protein